MISVRKLDKCNLEEYNKSIPERLTFSISSSLKTEYGHSENMATTRRMP